ncbi:MAG TPA: hypothetical protein VK688_03930, partial [Gemmatimonadales bacterium]|nr:hypothetical protein [Gemmatimonadales bacterium]
PSRGHLKCYTTRDPRSRARYTLTLQAGVAGFTNETGCKLQARAKELCVEVTKQHVVPQPPGGGPSPGPSTGAKLLSYRLKCPAQSPPAVNATDQFGPGLFPPRKAAGLLAPASPSGAFLDGSPVF